MKSGVVFAAGTLVGILASPAAVYAVQKVTDNTMTVRNEKDTSGYVRRHDDPNFKVKCWTYDQAHGGGISCLPWDEAKER